MHRQEGISVVVRIKLASPDPVTFYTILHEAVVRQVGALLKGQLDKFLTFRIFLKT